MPVLPLDHPEPFAATLGTMLYPGDDEVTRRKARAYAVHYLAKPIRQFMESGGGLDQAVLARLLTDGGERLDDLDDRWWRAKASGEIFKALFALANTDAALASWNNAIRVVEAVARRAGQRAARSFLWAARSQFLSVSHLWGAWSIRQGRFEPKPEVGYDGAADFQCFLTASEILRRWGQTWRAARDKSEPLLPVDVWRVHDDWSPPVRQPGWPETGRIPKLTLPQDLISGLKPAGRPKKAR